MRADHKDLETLLTHRLTTRYFLLTPFSSPYNWPYTASIDLSQMKQVWLPFECLEQTTLHPQASINLQHYASPQIKTYGKFCSVGIIVGLGWPSQHPWAQINLGSPATQRGTAGHPAWPHQTPASCACHGCTSAASQSVQGFLKKMF